MNANVLKKNFKSTLVADQLMLEPLSKFDIKHIATLYAATWRGEPYCEDWSLEAAVEALDSMAAGFKVATIDEHVVGFIGGNRWIDVAMHNVDFKPATAEIRSQGFSAYRAEYLAELAVMPEYRGRSLGSALLNEYIIQAKNRNSEVIILRTHACEKSNPATKLYKNFGFKILRKSSGEAITTTVTFPRISKATNDSDERPFHLLNLRHRH